jgi:hypothetical protein
MKRIFAVVLAALAFSNVALAQSNSQAAEQRDAFEVITKYSPL